MVLRRIAAEFEILRVFQIRWSPSLFSRNLSRFYGQNLPDGCNKEQSCGTGPFTLIVLRDSRPNYGMRQTTRGWNRVNVRTFDQKAFFRSTAGGRLPIHATDTARESAHDLALLLGVEVSAFESAYPGPWNGGSVSLRRDVSGANGWECLGDLFSVLNEAVDYVVLRNFEDLPECCHTESHGDIDLLVGSYADACLIANAIPVFGDPTRVHHTAVVGGETVAFDFRYVGDDYYDERWQRWMLESRRFVQGGFFVPDPENHFYSLLYHAAVHKPALSPDYAERLSEMAKSIGISIPSGEFFGDPRRIRSFLLDYMNPRRYRFTRPQDSTVYFNTAVTLGPIERVTNRILPQKRRLAPQRVTERADPVSHSDEHLTGAARANLLRPFEFSPTQRVLELGCEAGIITRHLGESGAEVVAIENIPGLAVLAEKRCRDLPNVRVICDDPLSAEVSGQFDVITLIGTPERTAEATDDPLDALLVRSIALLKEDGLLMLAIDNPLGLKYFNGCPEEGSGIPFFSFHGRGDSAACGRQALIGKLARAGLEIMEFLFPFPDYRLPNLILSERALQDSRLNVADLLIHNTDRNYPETRHRAFAEDLAWRTVIQNRLLPDLANSFLVVAKKNKERPCAASWLAKIYSRDRRRPCYKIESSITPDEAGNLVVRKRKLFPSVPIPDDTWLRHVVADSRYIPGHLCIGRIREAMAREDTVGALAAGFVPWLEFLLAHTTINAAGEPLLPAHFVDCIPANLIENDAGELCYFDAEWAGEDLIPLAWVIVRGVISALSGCLENRCLVGWTYKQLMVHVAQSAGIRISEAEFAIASDFEEKLAHYCMDGSANATYLKILDKPIAGVLRLSRGIPEQNPKFVRLSNELARVKGSVSWRVTSPLRVSWNLLRKLATVAANLRIR